MHNLKDLNDEEIRGSFMIKNCKRLYYNKTKFSL